ncbi:MAG: phosphate acyltransferase, partial [Bacillales bacterium]|nr:phosphate acyltransferase [Bacillales bacterium]
SNENTPQHLLQFAQMGNVYMKNMRNIDKPNVYLISNGAEEKKGSPLTKEAYTLLKDLSYFKGNIEAREVLSGEADVVVCPGFEGNILLKTTEGTASMILKMVKKAFKKNLLTKLGYLFSAIGFKELKVSMDYKKYGGAMFVGVNGVAVKAHGNSDEEAFYHAIRVTHELIKAGIVHKLQEEFKNA